MVAEDRCSPLNAHWSLTSFSRQTKGGNRVRKRDRKKQIDKERKREHGNKKEQTTVNHISEAKEWRCQSQQRAGKQATNQINRIQTRKRHREAQRN